MLKNCFKTLLALGFITLGLPLFLFVVNPSSKHPPQVYDCFLFFNELELLQIRMHEMAKHVDKFVIVEAAETFRGTPKPFTFAENRHLFEKFADKIIYVPLTETMQTDNPWHREHYQRQQIFRGLQNCHPNDIVIVSDVDEIIRQSRLQELVDLIASGEHKAVVCHQKMHFGYLNRYEDLWPGSVAIAYKDAKRLSARAIRSLRNRRPKHLRKAKIKNILLLEDAGWHFTSMGGVERYLKKMESYSHSEHDCPQIKSVQYFIDMVNLRKQVEVDETFPSYVQENLEHFEEIHFIDKKDSA